MRKFPSPKEQESKKQETIMHTYKLFIFRLVTAVILSLSATGQAALQDDLQNCAALSAEDQRLACYDALAETSRETVEPTALPATAPGTPDRERVSMTRHWDLRKSEGTFRFQSHKPVYFLPLRYSDNPDERPFRELISNGSGTEEEIDPVEAKFQISFKLKLIEGLLSERADLWLGYTQQSHWQVYNESVSRPFRETDYEPELMLVIRTDYDLFGLQGRFVNLGFVHQSNGRSEPLSRSWNRVYLQAGLEAGAFGFYLRPWYRIQENEADDDNPDINDFYGYGDLVLQYHIRDHTIEALVRGNLNEGHGALELYWTFPLYGRLRGYLQGFTGYGESLVDYNHEQTTIGFGISFSDWF